MLVHLAAQAARQSSSGTLCFSLCEDAPMRASSSRSRERIADDGVGQLLREVDAVLGGTTLAAALSGLDDEKVARLHEKLDGHMK